MSSWSQFVAGKRIAIVGPAPSVGDQSKEVDSHDVVIRVGYRSDLQKPPSGYGRKTDAVFYNYWNSRKLGLGLYDSFIYGIPWVVVKREYRRPAGLQNYHVASPPFRSANQVPILVHDLLINNCQSITIFGTDLYLGGPKRSYEKGYSGYIPERIWWEIQIHKPVLQHRFLRKAYLESGKIVGDERFLKAVNMSTKRYVRRLEKIWGSVTDNGL
jgi:hypothetical protein